VTQKNPTELHELFINWQIARVAAGNNPRSKKLAANVGDAKKAFDDAWYTMYQPMFDAVHSSTSAADMLYQAWQKAQELAGADPSPTNISRRDVVGNLFILVRMDEIEIDDYVCRRIEEVQASMAAS